jgi:glutamine synthetase
MARVPRERGKATRIELRLGDGSSNPYLATAAALFAGLDGIRRKLEPPEPFEGLIYEQPAAEECTPLPRTFDAAIEALNGDTLIKEAMGEELVNTFLTIKAAELERCKKWVTDWEFREYTHHL